MEGHSKILIQMPEIPERIESVSHAYSVALEIARVGDALGWRQLIKRIKPKVFSSLVKWRKTELDGQQPKSHEQQVQVVNHAVDIIGPLISVALVGVESANERLRDQKPILHDLLNIPEWNRAGFKIWANIPYALGYVYHSVHGGISLITTQLDTALRLAQVKIPIAEGTRYLPVWQIGELRGYPESLGGSCTEGWKYVAKAYEKKRWNWLPLIFEDDIEYRTSLVAYYMALNIHELATTIASGKLNTFSTSSNPYFHIPLTFLSEGYNINQRAISLLIRNPDALSILWTSVNVTREQMASSWTEWTRLCGNELMRYGFSFDPMAHQFLTDNYQHLFEVL